MWYSTAGCIVMLTLNLLMAPLVLRRSDRENAPASAPVVGLACGCCALVPGISARVSLTSAGLRARTSGLSTAMPRGAPSAS